MKYISIGNSTFNRDIIEILNLHQFDIYYPIDRAISTISVFNDCLTNGWDKFLDLANHQTGLDNDDLISYLAANHDEYHKLNTYQCLFYFYGMNIDSDDTAKMYLQLWINNLMNVINSNEDITFIFTNQNAMFIKDFRDKQELYYHKLLELIDILKTKYNKHNVKILAFFTNQTFANTHEVEVHSVDITPEYISDNHETHNPETTQMFIDQFIEKLRTILGL